MGIKIVDPNKVISQYISDYQSGQPFPGNIGEGAVTTPPEDLVTYVDLEVFLPGRSTIVDDIARQTQKRENIGFVVPKNLPKENYGQLGTSWTNIGGLQGFQKNNDGKYTVDGSGNFQKEGDFTETFGIQDIQIKLNASFEPQVFITFVDIRGASLMEPGLNSPYSAFFHMPYPLFTLTVKGFYGRGISYKLHLMKFNSRFDNDTGNFVINCEFIGFTFTYLADMAAIYADVGPDLLGFYGTEEGGAKEFATEFESGRDPSKPWPEGSMTLGVYISNIATLAAKMDHFADDSIADDYYLVQKSIKELERIEKRFSRIFVNLGCEGVSANACLYRYSTSMVITCKALFKKVDGDFDTWTGTRNMVTISEAKALRRQNYQDIYRLLLLQLRGNDTNKAQVNTVSSNESNFLGFVKNIYDNIDEITTGFLGSPPSPSLINQGDDNYEVFGKSKVDFLVSQELKGSTQRFGIGEIDAQEYFKQLRNYITRGKQKEVDLKRKMNEQENALKLDTLVMPPTLENVFKLLCNGITAFQKVLVEVGTLAYDQHNNDEKIKSLLLNSGGSDIKSLESNESKMYAFPLYYETRTDSIPLGTTGKPQPVSRVEKQFPGWKVDSSTYGRPDFITPKKWPEITLVENLISFIIKKQKELKQSFDPEDNEFTNGYIPALVEETPLLPISPYLRLTNIETQIIPLLMIRSMMRLGHTNNFPVYSQTTDYPGFGDEDDDTISVIKTALSNDSSESVPSKDNGGFDALGALGELEAETLFAGMLDTGKKRLKELLKILTNSYSTNTQRGKGGSAVDQSLKLLKDAGYYIETKSGTDGDEFIGYRGAKEPLANVYTYNSVVGEIGQEVNTINEFWLPNIDTKLSTNIFYDTCSGADYAMECKGFYISSVAFYEENNELSEAQKVETDSAGEKLIKWYEMCYGESGGEDSEYSRVGKLIIGPQGTLDYDYKRWLGWDFFSLWSRAKYQKKVEVDLETNNFSSENHTKPDQFAPHALKYSMPTKLRSKGEGSSREWGWNSDRQTLILEDFLWIKNDWENTTINNYTVQDDNGEYQYIPYSRAADSNGYTEALNSAGSGVVNPQAASNLALGYLYINNVGKYYAASSTPRSTPFTQKFDITRFFDQFAGYSTVPEYIVLQIGSWLYRYQEENDIIRWPNYFTTTGVKKNGQWTFRIPKKGERPQPKGDMISAKQPTGYGDMTYVWSTTYRRINKRGFNANIENDLNWMGASDFNNTCWFIAGQRTDWKSLNGGQLFKEAEDFGYDDIGSVFKMLAPEIKSQFVDAFIMWATGRPLETQTYNLGPSFPDIKRALTATVKVEENLWEDRGFCFDMSDYSLSQCAGCMSNSTPPTPNLNPKSRLWTSFCDRQLVGTYDSDFAYPGVGFTGHAVLNDTPVWTPPAQVGVVTSDFFSDNMKQFDFNNGLSTGTIEGTYNLSQAFGGSDIAYHVKKPYGQVSFATRETDMSATTDNYLHNFVNDEIKHSYGTFTLPLLYNGFVNNVKNHGQDNFNGKKPRPGAQTDAVSYTGLHDRTTNINNEGGAMQETLYHPTAGGGVNYFFIRKASHTNRIAQFNMGTNQERVVGSWDWPGVGDNNNGLMRPPASEEIQIEQNGKWYYNDSYNGFPEVGQEVYMNLHYRHPIRSQWFTGKMEEDDIGDYSSINYDETHPFLKEEWSFLTSETPAFNGKPTFYMSRTHYNPNYIESPNNNNESYAIDNNIIGGSVPTQRNELYEMLETFMKNRVVVKNVTWRQWLGVGTNDSTKQVYNNFSTIFTSKEFLTRYFDGFINKLADYIDKGDEKEDRKNIAKEEGILDDNDIKLDTYLTLKNIHDKWLTGSAAEGLRKVKLNATYDFNQNKESWLFSQFSFVDRAYTDISHKVIDPTPLLNLKENPKISLYTLMYDLIAHNQFEFFPLPTTVDFASKNFEKSFIPHLTVDKESIDQNPRFYVMYMGGFSDSLDMESSTYEFANDGFDITPEPCIDCPADFYKGDITTISNQESLPNAVLLIEGQAEDDGGFRIGGPGGAISVPSYGNWKCVGNSGFGDCKIQKPELKAFAINYAQDNQNFFKSIALDQAEFQETQESLLIIDALSHEEGTTKDPMLKGQNLLNVYQKRSYTCKVEAFGMMSILPLQYFQLNNVPMFHGAYLITNVEHKVTQGDVSTSFEGVRVSQSVIPYVSGFLTAIQDSSESSPIIYNEKLDTRDLNVLSGDVERVGLWRSGTFKESTLGGIQKLGVNSVALAIETDWAEVSGGSTRWKGDSWDWQPYKQFDNGKQADWTKNARYTLDGLKNVVKLLSEADIYITLMLYFNPNYNYIEPMCGGSGMKNINGTTDYLKKDYASQNIDTPFTIPELVNELNNHCTKCKVDAIEFDLEGHYRKTVYSSGWKTGEKPLGYDDSVNKKDLAKAVMKKLRDTLPTGTEVGTTLYVGKTVSTNENYWKDPAHPEYSCLADYVAVQAYTFAKCKPQNCKSCTLDTDCVEGAFCGDMGNGKGKKCYNTDYSWGGYAGPGNYQRFSGNTVKKISESNFNGADPTNGKPYLIMGLAAYHQKFEDHTISEALVEAWNGGVQPIASSSYKPTEVRYWSYANVFGSNGGYDSITKSGPVADFIKEQTSKINEEST